MVSWPSVSSMLSTTHRTYSMITHSMLSFTLLFWVALLVTFGFHAIVLAAPLAGRGPLKPGAALDERAGKIHFTTNSTFRQDVHPLPRGKHAYSAALPVQVQAERGHKVVVARGSAGLKRISMEHGEGQEEGGVVSG